MKTGEEFLIILSCVDSRKLADQKFGVLSAKDLDIGFRLELEEMLLTVSVSEITPSCIVFTNIWGVKHHRFFH